MKLQSKEYYDLMNAFERWHKGERFDREDSEWWHRGVVYQDGRVNELFKAFQRGYAFAESQHRLEV